MLYADIVDIIESIAEEVNDVGTFIHGRRVDGSLAYPDPMPQIHLYPFTTNIDVANGLDTSNISMGFWMQGGAEANADECKEFITKADILMRAFLKELYTHTEIDLSAVRSEPAYNLFTAVLTGYQLSFTITTKHKTC
jgi:hypothetical protein